MGRRIPRVYKIQSKDPVFNRFQDEIVAAINSLADAVVNSVSTIGGGHGDASTATTTTDSAGWYEETFYYPSPLVLSRTPLRSSIMVFKNGLLERSWTLSGRLVVLVSALTAEDAHVVIRYQV